MEDDSLLCLHAIFTVAWWSSIECLSKLIACNPEVLLMLKLYRASKNNEEFPAVLQSLFYTCIEIALALKSNFCDKTEVNKWATKIKSILNCKIYWTKNETDIINMFYGYLCQTKKTLIELMFAYAKRIYNLL